MGACRENVPIDFGFNIVQIFTIPDMVDIRTAPKSIYFIQALFDVFVVMLP